MNLFKSLNEAVNARLNKPVICWGVFDGVHKGHSEIIKQLLSKATQNQSDSLLITFNNHPKEFLTFSRVDLIYPIEVRLKHIEKHGVENCLLLEFNNDIANFKALDFISMLKTKFNLSGIVLGKNAIFGSDSQKASDILPIAEKKFNISTQICPQIFYKNNLISSSWIRNGLKNGNIPLINTLLNREFSLFGKVVKGDNRGRSLGFPTANIEVENKILPPNGTYCGFTEINENKFLALVNIGTNPTFNNLIPDKPKVEAFILNFKGNLYSKRMTVALTEFIRNEIKFNSKEALINKINEDVAYIQSKYSNNNCLSCSTSNKTQKETELNLPSS